MKRKPWWDVVDHEIRYCNEIKSVQGRFFPDASKMRSLSIV